MTESSFGTFFLPGPTEVRPAVLRAMLRPMIAHRGQAFEELFARVQEGLRHVFRTTRPVYVSTSSATGLMEAAVRGAAPGPVLAVVNGAFSDRFRQIAVQCGREVEVLAVAPGGAVALEELDKRLAARRFAAVTVVHSETSTGALTDVRGVSALARRHGALCLVDSVTGVGGAPLEFDAWELDFALTGSQKALALPPGLAFAVASERYLATVADAPARGVYFDILEFERFAAKRQTPNTPAVSLLYAAEAQLADIVAQGIERRWDEHRAMAERTWRWVEQTAAATGLPLRVLAAEGQRSPTVTAVECPPPIAKALPVAVARRGYTIGGGYGPVRDTTFRIGHMGDHTVATLEGCLAVCAEELARLG